MPADDKNDALFSAEMKRRFEDLAAWAIENCPDRQNPIKDADFNTCRQQIVALAGGVRKHENQRLKQDANQDVKQDIDHQNKAIPEPSDSGPQYVNVTPSPWP
jgi:hypothetical protein